MAAAGEGASQNVTASVVVGVSAKPVRVFGLTIKSGATAGIVQLFNGTSNGGTEKFIGTGTISTGNTVSFGNRGKFFPGGCFCQIDGNVTYADVDYIQVTT